MISMFMSVVGGTAVMLGVAWTTFLIYDRKWDEVPAGVILVALGFYLLDRL